MKPDWCPADIWETANQACMTAIGAGEKYGPSVVARAILAERERCAAITKDKLDRAYEAKSASREADAYSLISWSLSQIRGATP